MAGKHTFSTAVAHWRDIDTDTDTDAEPMEVVWTHLPYPGDFDAMLAFLRLSRNQTQCPRRHGSPPPFPADGLPGTSCWGVRLSRAPS